LIGNGYWSTGITVRYDSRRGWGGEVQFYDDGFANDETDHARISTEGALRTRYFAADGEQRDALTVVIDTLKADAERHGIRWAETAGVWYHSDGGDDRFPPPPGWRELLNSHSRRLEWEPKYLTVGQQN